jgi:hypothetical protein
VFFYVGKKEGIAARKMISNKKPARAGLNI